MLFCAETLKIGSAHFTRIATRYNAGHMVLDFKPPASLFVAQWNGDYSSMRPEAETQRAQRKNVTILYYCPLLPHHQQLMENYA